MTRFALLAILSLAPMANHPNTSTWHDALQVMRHGVENEGDAITGKLPTCQDAIEMPDEYDMVSDT